eukprot:1437162-Pleurochrysis_carterae.AAC.1
MTAAVTSERDAHQFPVAFDVILEEEQEHTHTVRLGRKQIVPVLDFLHVPLLHGDWHDGWEAERRVALQIGIVQLHGRLVRKRHKACIHDPV